MGRKSNGLDRKMIAAGIELVKEHGIASFSVRDVVNRAGANLGMFNYHFGTKEKFVLILLNEFYLDFLAKIENGQAISPNLESVLFQIAVFSRDSRKIITSILSDVLANDPTVTEFLKNNFSKHFLLLESTLEKHLRAKRLTAANPNHATRFLIGAVGVPNILLEIYNREVRKQVPPENDLELKMRVRAAIHGLESEFCKKRKPSTGKT